MLNFDLGIGSVNISFGFAVYVIAIGIVLGYVFAFVKSEDDEKVSKVEQNTED